MIEVGTLVQLNDDGLRCIFGTTMGLGNMKLKVMSVTEVDRFSMTTDVPSYNMRVDDPEIDQFVLCTPMFDEVF